MSDINDFLDAAFESARRAKQEQDAAHDPLHQAKCPHCQEDAAYYFLKSSGRCTGCGFHWGIS